MGCVASLGLGLAKARPERRVVVIDGDGAMLMRLEAVATIGHERPPNLVHVLLDRQMPSRLAGAFPEGVELRRSGLAEVVAATRDFLARERGAAHAGGRR